MRARAPLRARLAAAPRRVARAASLFAATLLAASLLIGAAGPAAAAPAQDLDATLTCEPTEARIGEPLTWTLLVWHDVDEQLLPVDGLVPPDDTWVRLDGPHRARVESGEGALTRVEWTVMSLDPGERPLPALDLTLDGGVTLTARPGEVRVLGELAEGEDAPRPLPEPLDAPPAGGGARWVPFALWALYLGAPVLALVLAARQRAAARAAAANAEPSAARGLAGLATPGEADAEALRAHAGRLSRALREGLQAPDAAVPAGLEDHEWAAFVRRHGLLAEAPARRAEALLQELEAVEYGGAAPDAAELERWRARALELEAEVRASRAPGAGAPVAVGAAPGGGARGGEA